MLVPAGHATASFPRRFTVESPVVETDGDNRPLGLGPPGGLVSKLHAQRLAEDQEILSIIMVAMRVLQ